MDNQLVIDAVYVCPEAETPSFGERITRSNQPWARQRPAAYMNSRVYTSTR
jgi:hypothetical protein